MRMLATAIMATLVSGAACAAPTFTTIDNPADPTFNQLLGINNAGVISGYFGSGAAGHPNIGYTIAAPYTTFQPDNLPGSVQTQATGINKSLATTGFWSNTNMGPGLDANFGFIRWNNHGKFTYLSVNNPLVASTPSVNQMLGINDSNIAVGFYNDANNAPHGYAYVVKTGQFAPVKVGGAVSDAATGINDHDLICGFFTNGNGRTLGFLKPLHDGKTTGFGVPNEPVTQFLGVNNSGIAVGLFMNTDMIPHGVIYNPANGQWMQVDVPGDAGGTVLNGLNDKGEIVGFYTDAAGNTHGLLVTGAF